MGILLPFWKHFKKIFPVQCITDIRLFPKNIGRDPNLCRNYFPAVFISREQNTPQLFACKRHSQIRPKRHSQNTPVKRADPRGNINRYFLPFLLIHGFDHFSISPCNRTAQTHTKHRIYHNSIFFPWNICDNLHAQIPGNLPLHPALFTHGCLTAHKYCTYSFPFHMQKSCNCKSVSSIIPAAAYYQTLFQSDLSLLHHFHCL